MVTTVATDHDSARHHVQERLQHVPLLSHAHCESSDISLHGFSASCAAQRPNSRWACPTQPRLTPPAPISPRHRQPPNLRVERPSKRCAYVVYMVIFRRAVNRQHLPVPMGTPQTLISGVPCDASSICDTDARIPGDHAGNCRLSVLPCLDSVQCSVCM